LVDFQVHGVSLAISIISIYNQMKKVVYEEMYMAFSTMMYGRSVVISEINKDSPSTSLAPTTAVDLWKGLLGSARDEQETYKVCGT